MKHLSPFWSLLSGTFLVVLLVTGCRTNKYVPKGDYLLSEVTIHTDNHEIDRNILKTYQRQKPNTKIFGFWKFHLGLYNLSSKKNEKGWFKRIGEAPVIYDPYLTEKTKTEFGRYLQNKGFYNAVIRDSTVLRANGKAEVHYFIQSNTPYRIHQFSAEIKDDSLRRYLQAKEEGSKLKSNGYFDSDELNNETNRLLKELQNGGYYKATRNIFYYEADSTRENHSVDLKLIVEKESYADTAGRVAYKNHERYYLHNFYYLNEKDIQSTLLSDNGTTDTTRNDTLRIGHHFFVYKGKRRLKPDLLMNANHIDDKPYFSQELVDRTYNDLFALRLFKVVNIRFAETREKDAAGNPLLDCYIQVTPGLNQSYSASVEGTNSLGNLGVAGNLGYQHKNLFRGGEVLDLQFLAATQKQSFGAGDSASTFHTVETGVDARITIPKYLVPLIRRNFFEYSAPQTFFNTSYNYQQRPDYTRTIARLAFGYQWKSSNFTTHRVNVLDINLVKMFALDSLFLDRIENLYIRSSYIDHSITAFNYSYTYSTQTQNKSDYVVTKFNGETAGNLLYGVRTLFGNAKRLADIGTIHQYTFLNTPFAQYLKLDFEYRRGWMDRIGNGFAVRGFAGVAFAYGNADQVPFERKYFSGGANGLRAWPIRTLGPGTYRAGANEFPNQSGDIKLEGNAEYRFLLMKPLEGAFFVDLGNIWSVKDNRPGTEFALNRFYKEIAVGSGLGLRYDFSYVILRLDLGVKVHDPSLDEGKRWLSPNQYFQSGNINFVFGIGYPF
ncbi:MAG: BamA/TamA family outer membrane protein [Marinilabiliales bacterium]|nr:BamA/TamA family outer membrane protein [Marinilabiliales bacterium]